MEEIAPVQPTTAVAQPTLLRTLFGQFFTRDFWRDLAALIIKEAVSSFISSFGATLVYYVRNRATNDSTVIRNIATGGQVASAPTGSPASAFSTGFVPQTQYKPTYPTPGQPGSTFPGFG